MSDIEQDAPVGVTQGPAVRSEEDRDLAERLVAEADDKGLHLVGPDGVLTGLTKRVLEAGLKAELTEHLGNKHNVSRETISKTADAILPLSPSQTTMHADLVCCI